MTPLLIVGASGRAAATWARSEGYKPHVIDLFADVDTFEIAASVQQCEWEHYPEGLVDRAMNMEPMAWMYTGGIENHPTMIDAISAKHRLFGNDSTTVRRVRDPFALQEFCERNRIAFPASEREFPDDGNRYLKKPIRSAGGLSIEFAVAHPHNQHRATHEVRGVTPRRLLRAWLAEEHYFQQYLQGTAVSAVFEGQQLIGYSKQLIDLPLHAAPFVYAGSLTDHDERRLKQWKQIGDAMHDEFQLQGHWGIDGVDHDGRIHVLEINPRYCASRELFEFAGLASDGRCGVQNPSLARPANKHIKAIYYAPHDITVPRHMPWNATTPHLYADIPRPLSFIRAGHPVVTILASGDSEPSCRDRILTTIRLLDTLFGAAS
jgi:predicted ATP-grasp superfamily ATP-dependent carboligase